MNKILKLIIFTGLLLIGISIACNLPSQMSTETPAPTIRPMETVTPAATPTLSASATPEFAPFCESGTANVSPPAQCKIPIAEESSTFCTKKKPYTLIFMNKGASFEVQTKGFKCSDAGVKDGRQMVTCTGKMAAQFELMVCDPTCAVPTVQALVTQCPQGYTYSNLQGCCTQEVQQTLPNCVVLKLKTTTCMVNCESFDKKSTCAEHSDACYWDGKECNLRK